MLGTFVGNFVPPARRINTSSPLTGGSNLSSDLTLSIEVFGPSGSGHAAGIVPDPGATAGTTHYLREDGTWAVPSGGSGTVAIANGGTGATSAPSALANLGALPLAGNSSSTAMTGTLYMGGKGMRGLNQILDNQATPVVRIGTGGASGASATTVNDSNGNAQITVSPGTATVNGVLSVSGNATLSGGTTTVSGTLNAAGATTLSGTTTFGNTLRPAGWTAQQLIYVDPTVNEDIGSQDGTALNPFGDIPTAVAAASSGQAIFLLPGTYSLSAKITLPAGVSLIGSGMGVSVLNFTMSSNYTTCIVPGTGSVISDLTINGPTNGAPGAGAPVGANAFSGDVMPTSFYLRRLAVTGAVDALYLGCNNGGSIPAVYAECRDCVFASHYDTVNAVNGSGTNAGNVWALSVDFINCKFLPTFVYTGGTTPLRGVAGVGNYHLYHCLITITDLTNSTIGAGGDYGIHGNGTNAGTGTQNIFLEGTTINYVTPNATSGSIVMPIFANPTDGSTSIVTVGDGCTFDASICQAGSTGQIGFSPMVCAGQSTALTVASPSGAGSITPFCTGWRSEQTAAASSATLTSSTLTINAPGSVTNGGGITVGANTPSDGQSMRLRINNSAGSGNLTLSFNSVYNLAGFSIGTIAAGKRAYFDFVYDADNSKWDLAGYVNGI